ncbi:MAG TPA: DedA family protein [Bacteroidota bacterium]|nr:DedA family protein [Bacteroidota bacterium]
MDLIKEAIEFVLHIDAHLLSLCTAYGAWVYAIVFLIVFCETGLVVTPFLPGDSLLFAIGSLVSLGALEGRIAGPLLVAAALCGDNVNYWVGRYLGPRVFQKENSRLFNKEYLERTHRFYERHGRKTVVIARFLPIIRTFAPFVAGIGRMNYRIFLTFSVLGAALWVALFLGGGYFFGNIPAVKNNFSIVILALILIPGAPAFIEFVRMRFGRKKVRVSEE